MTPLAERMRPQSFDTYVGQEHLTGPQGILRSAVQKSFLPHMLLWGPPGVGKTTLAHVLANEAHREIMAISAVNAGVKELRELLEQAEKKRFFDTPGPILFIDEIHRFNKNQQDALLHALEKGVITFIGATTENPSFEVNTALLSRCQVYILQPLNSAQLTALIHHAIRTDTELKKLDISLQEDAMLLHLSGGDARKLYNLLELACTEVNDNKVIITDALIQSKAQQFLSMYDKGGEQHYDIVSAFIKSMRGGDPDAALYWCARMIKGGEPPEFITRRMLILSAEDIGLANPNALLIATACAQAVERIGWPESRIILAEAIVYLATSPKSNSAYMAIESALASVDKYGNQPIPLHLRNAVTGLMKNSGYGKGYLYGHDHPGNFTEQQYLPEALQQERFYYPGNNPQEKIIKDRLVAWWKVRFL